MGFNRKKWLIQRHYEHYDPVEADRVNRAIYEAKLCTAGLKIPKRGRKTAQRS
jgi:hypothetical protein